MWWSLQNFLPTERERGEADEQTSLLNYEMRLRPWCRNIQWLYMFFLIILICSHIGWLFKKRQQHSLSGLRTRIDCNESPYSVNSRSWSRLSGFESNPKSTEIIIKATHSSYKQCCPRGRRRTWVGVTDRWWPNSDPDGEVSCCHTLLSGFWCIYKVLV